VSWRER